jgi:serine phosphatase RsbU (regulator of sigma subunit)
MAGAGDQAPAAFLGAANGVIHRMGLYRMAMALVVARLAGRRLTLSSAGMPPALHFKAGQGAVEEIVVPGTPLGARAEFPYAEATAELRPGDALLLGSDGFAELPNAAGEPFGYERAREAFAACAALPASEAVAALRAAAAAWTGGAAPCDDVTFLVLKSTAA